MTPPSGPLGTLAPEQRAALQRALARWRDHRARPESGATADPGRADADEPRGGDRSVGADIELVAAEVLAPGRPGVVDVLATMDGRLAHAVLGLRQPGDESRAVGPVEEAALGMVEDEHGAAVVVDALHDTGLARALLDVVVGQPVPTGDAGPAGRPAAARRPRGGRPRRLEPGTGVVSIPVDDDEVTTLVFARRCSLSVFPWLRTGPHPGVALLTALDDAGFNHLAAPIAVWRRAGRDLGVAQELLSGATGGWAVAQTSLRDLFASGLRPAAAGGDFAPEARALGTMAARMHLALDRAFGRRPGDLEAWIDGVEADIAAAPAGVLDAGAARAAAAALRQAGAGPPALRPPIVRGHGDFHLGRTARTDHGWVLADCMPGGTPPGSDEPAFRSPLADLADMVWSLRHAAETAAAVRGPVGAPPLGSLAHAWAERNRRAFLTGYLSTPGVGDLVPADRDLARRMVGLFELGRVARSATAPAA